MNASKISQTISTPVGKHRKSSCNLARRNSHEMNVLLTALAMCVVPLTATAQATGPVSAQKPAAPVEKLEEIVVTGSRLVTNGNDAPTPVTVMNLDEMSATKPATVFEQLSELPAFNGSGGASGIPSRGINSNNNNSTSSLNLRGLGSIRALVLFDGHRVPPSTPDGQVAINLMPQMLMQRVDVVTGGASAVYGSDAISGVMNFIIDRKFNGIKFDVRGGQSSRNDDGSYSVGIAAGTDLFGGRGHIEASYQHDGDQGLPTYLTRPSLFNWTLQGDGSPGNPYHSVQGVTISNFSFGGVIGTAGSLQNYSFDTNGVLTPQVMGPTAGLNPSRMLGGGGAYVTVTALKSRTHDDQFFTRFDYDVTENVHAWANLAGANDYTMGGGQPSLNFGIRFSGCNAFLAKQYQVALGCTDPTNVAQQSSSVFQLFKLPDPRYNALKTTYTSAYLRNYSFMGGLEGKIATDYHWDATYTFSETKDDVRNDRININPHFFAAMDAVINPANGQIVCNITLTNPGLQPGCVPINMFGPSAESQAAVDYTNARVERWATTQLNGLAANLRGTPIEGWAGPLGFAVSGEYRHQTLELHSNTPLTPVDCTGIRFSCNSTTTLFSNSIAPLSQVQQDTTEAAVELNVPLLKDIPLVQSLSFNPAARYTRYDNKGNGVSTTFNASTWKLGLVWNLSDQLALRWTRSRDIRAPNLWDLFNPVASTNSNPGATDFLTPNTPQAQLAGQQTGGNPNLRPEIALTTTVGLVWKPTSEFSLAIDGYLINMKDAIAVATGSNPDIQKACYASGGTSPYCALQTRALGNYTDTSAANYVTKWFNQGVNIGLLKTSGIDLESNYRTRVADRPFSVRALVAYKPHLIYAQSALPTIDQAGAAYCACSGVVLLPNPVWRAEGFLNYDLVQDLTMSVSERWRSHLFLQGNRSLIELGGGVPAYYTTNMSLTYRLPKWSGRLQVYLNVQNVFDKLAPPVGANNVQGGLPGDFGSYALGDDFIGRYYVLGVRARL